MSLLAAAALGVVVAFVIHEGAHLLAAWLLGGTELRLSRRGLSAQVEATLASRGRVLVFTLAGPGANVALGLALVTLWADDRVQTVGLLNLMLALASLVPWGTSDGARALALRRSGG